MGRNRYKFFEPPVLPPGYVSPGGAMKWVKPPDPTEADTTVDVDKAKGRVKKEASDTAASTDHFIGVDTGSQAVTITLPATTSVTVGKIFLVKDEGGNAGTNNITVATTGDVNIDGRSTITLDSDYASISVYYNGTEWSVY
jgi:hypothetical protein